MAGEHIKLMEVVGQANNALRLANEALGDFSRAVSRYDWKAAEDARLRAVTNVEAYLDGLAGVYRRLEQK